MSIFMHGSDCCDERNNMVVTPQNSLNEWYDGAIVSLGKFTYVGGTWTYNRAITGEYYVKKEPEIGESWINISLPPNDGMVIIKYKIDIEDVTLLEVGAVSLDTSIGMHSRTLILNNPAIFEMRIVTSAVSEFQFYGLYT